MSGQGSMPPFEEVYVEFHRKISMAWHKRMDKILPGSQAMILRMLEKEGPLKVSTLAEAMHITPGAVTGLCDKLLGSGYAERKRDDADRRVVYLEITEQGRQILEQFRKESRQSVKQFFEGIPDEDLHHLARIYQSVLANLERWKEGERE